MAPCADVTWTPLSGLVYLGGGRGTRLQSILLPTPHCCPESLLSSGLTLRPSRSRRGHGGPSGAQGPLPEAVSLPGPFPNAPDSWFDPGGQRPPPPIDQARLSAQSSGPSGNASWHCGPSESGSGTSSHRCGTCCGATPYSSRRPTPSAWSSRRRWASPAMPRPCNAMSRPRHAPPMPCHAPRHATPRHAHAATLMPLPATPPPYHAPSAPMQPH